MAYDGHAPRDIRKFRHLFRDRGWRGLAHAGAVKSQRPGAIRRIRHRSGHLDRDTRQPVRRAWAGRVHQWSARKLVLSRYHRRRHGTLLLIHGHRLAWTPARPVRRAAQRGQPDFPPLLHRQHLWNMVHPRRHAGRDRGDAPGHQGRPGRHGSHGLLQLFWS